MFAAAAKQAGRIAEPIHTAPALTFRPRSGRDFRQQVTRCCLRRTQQIGCGGRNHGKIKCPVGSATEFAIARHGAFCDVGIGRYGTKDKRSGAGSGSDGLTL